MKVMLAQINTTVGALDENADAISRNAQRAADQGADLVVFPELSVIGYPPWDLLERPRFIERAREAESRIVEALPGGLTAIFGNVRRRPIPPTYGRALENVAVVARRGHADHVVKALLPTYDVFDEARYFEPAPRAQRGLFEIAGRRVGVTVCEDIWNDDQLWRHEDLWRDKAPGHHRLYARDPVFELKSAGAEIIVNVSASPWARGKFSVRLRVLRNLARRYGVHCVYTNLVGANDGLIFDGRSVALGPDGSVLTALSPWTEAETVVDLGSSAAGPDPEPDDTLADIRSALTLGIRDYFEKSGLGLAVVGLSGGIDSAVTAYLAVEALGTDRVIGVSMPSRYSSDHSIADAKALARNLGCAFELVSIEEPFAAFLGALQKPFAGRAPDITEENLQSRIRGTVLMAFSNKLGGVVLCTGNKSEAAMGYATLYGDTVGALAVLGDLYKGQVYGLARLANREREIIPASTITKPPSAELRPDQKDTDSLPPYEVLDPMLEQFIERRKTAAEIAEAVGVERAYAERVIRTVYRNEFKRKQLPPTLRVSRKAWVGRVYPIVNQFDE